MLERSLEDALANLYDLSYLANHALGKVLSTGDPPVSPDWLHRRLLDTIDLLRPPPGSPRTSAIGRRHRYLLQRYVSGQSHKEVATELGLSVRQAHRVRTSAIVAVTALLNEDRGNEAGLLSARPLLSTIQEHGIHRPGDSRATLDDEVARLTHEAVGSLSDLSHEIREAVDTIEPLARQRGVSVDLELPEGPCLVAVDDALLRPAIVLLVTYALDRQLDGQVGVSIESGPAWIAVDIVYGRGIGSRSTPPAIEDSRLTTARRLVEAQGGALERITGDEHGGLQLVLPPGKTATVLTVDDNPELGRLFEHYLRGTRYLVKRAKTGQTALRLAEQSDVDVVTLDVMMPFQDGWEIFRQLRENEGTRWIPVIVCSILPEKELALAVGATDFLAKPVSRRSLLTALDRCCPSGSRVSRVPA